MGRGVGHRLLHKVRSGFSGAEPFSTTRADPAILPI
jgi:hypothetical protein